MYCTQCGVELRADDRFCSRCGKRTGVGRIETNARPLMLDKRNKKLAGVCAGFARYMEVDVILVRTVWLVVAVATVSSQPRWKMRCRRDARSSLTCAMPLP